MRLDDNVNVNADEKAVSGNCELKSSETDPYCKKALKFWIEQNGGKASIASLQRALMIGFNRAGRIFEYLQKAGYLESYADDVPYSKPIKVLVAPEDLDALFPDQEA